jgi:hypothetical protein
MKKKVAPPDPEKERRLERQQRKALVRFFRATEALGEKATVRIRGTAVNTTYFGHKKRARRTSE